MPRKRVGTSLPLLPPLPQKARTLDVVCNPIRASPIPPLEPAAMERLPPFLVFEPAAHVPPNALRFKVDPAHLEAGADVPLIVESLDEPVDFVKYIVRGQREQDVLLVLAPDFGAPE